MEDHEPTAKDHWACVGVPLLVGSILLVAGLFVGFTPVGGHWDNESFTCGSPFLEAGDDGGYGGSEQYDACLQERSHLRPVAWGGVGLGALSLLGSVLALWSHHRRPD
ncbi:hypothetical protein NODU109028_02535 [Nocardioides dubius]|uniref:Uncharacterized protein n=1 Tax=Nocardioides dubius TaxID=317019 RepID=A0ABP4EBK4_9ACTN